MNHYLGLNVFCLLFFLPGRAVAQPYTHAIHHISIEKGLPHRAVYDVQQDHDGFIWLACHAGIFIFNGYDFQQVKLTRPAPRQRLFKDPDGMIWAGSSVFDKPHFNKTTLNLAAQHFFDILLPCTREAISFDEYFSRSCPFRETDIRFVRQVAGTIWIETKQGVCYSYEGYGVFCRRFELKGELANAFNVEPAANGNFWLCQENACREFDPSGALLQTVPFELPGKIIEYHSDDSGGFWVSAIRHAGTPELVTGQLFQIAGGEKKLIWQSPNMPLHPYSYMAASRVLTGENGLHWAWSLGVCRALDAAGNTILDVMPLLQAGKTDKVDIHALFTDRQSRLWVATSNGVFVISLRKNLFRVFFHQPGSESSFRGMAQDSRGTIYFNTYTSSTSQLRLPEDRPVSPNFPHDAISLALWRDAPADVFWLTAHNNGIRRFDLATEKADIFSFPDGESKESNAIYRDKRTRQLWVGKFDGLALFDPASGIVSLAKSGFPALRGKVVRGFYENLEGLWLATSQGLFLLDVVKKTSRQFSTATGDLTFDNLAHVCQDGSNADVFWLSTQGSGLLKWNRRTGKSQSFSMTEGLSNDYVHAAYESDSATLWLPSNNGLMRFHKASGKVDVFTTDDGLPSNEFNFLSHLRSADGTFWFGGMNGVVAFRPEEISAAMRPASPLRLTGAEVLSGSSKIWEDRLPDIKIAQQILLRSDDYSLTLKLALMDYLHPEGNRFSYRIEGLNQSEISVESNTIRLGSLPSGSYRLLVEGRPSGGFGAFSTLSIQLVVQAPFWRTGWFLTLAALGLALLLFSIIRLRTRQLRLQKARLEWLIASRSKEILEKNQRLEQANATKDRLFSIISHELKDHAVSFLGIAKKVNYLLKNNQPERLLQLGDHIEKSARNLEGLLDNLLGWALAQRSGITCRPEHVPVGEVVAETLSIFQPLAEPKEICFETRMPFGTAVFADKQAFATVLRNLVGNAVKFSPQHSCVQIWVDPDEPGGLLEIVIQNGGLSIQPDRLDTLFTTYPGKSTPGTIGEKGAGLGLTLCKYLVEMNGGGIQLKSEAGKGTRVRLRLPVSKAVGQADGKFASGKINLKVRDVFHV